MAGGQAASAKINYATLGDEFDASGLNYDSLVSEFDSDNQSTLSKVGKRAIGALPLGSDFSEGYQRGINRSTTRMSDAATSMGESGLSPSNVGSMALGGLEYLASPFEGAGTFIGNPIRRAGEGVPGVELAAQTAELAPLMAAPIPGAKTIQGIGAGVGGVIGEAPAAMAALKNAVPYFRSLLGLGPKIEASAAAVSTPKSDMLPGQTATTSRVTEREGIPGWQEPDFAPQDWYQRQFRGGEPQDLPPTGAEPARPIVGPAPNKKTKGQVLMPEYRNLGERPTRRTSHLPRTPEEAADAAYYEGAFADEMQGRNVPTDVPLDGGPVNLQYMRLPNVRDATPVDPVLEQQIKNAYFRKQQTGPMRERTGGGMPWAPTREPVGDPLDDLYKGFFTGETPPGGGGIPTFPVGPRPNNPTVNRVSPAEPFEAGPPMADASNDNLDDIYSSFFTAKGGPSLRSPYRQSGGGGGDLPPAPKPTPTRLPREKPMRGAQSSLDDPTVTDLTGSKPELYYDWDDKNPALFGRPPMELPPVPPRSTPPTTPPAAVSPPMSAAPNENALRDRLKSFKGGPVGELPPLPMRPEASKPAPAATAQPTINAGDEVEIVHNVGGQEMRAAGGRVVELIEKQEPKFNKGQLRNEDGSMPERVTYEPRQYAKLEDGREVPVTLLRSMTPPKGGTPWGAPPNAPAPKTAKAVGGKSKFTQPPKNTTYADEVAAREQNFTENHPDPKPIIENMIAAIEEFKRVLPKGSAPAAAAPKDPALVKLETAMEKARKAYGANPDSDAAQKKLLAASKAVEDWNAANKPLTPKPSGSRKTSKAMATETSAATKYDMSVGEAELAKAVTKASDDLIANPSIENSQKFNDALQALHAASPKVETAAERALKKHMQAQQLTSAPNVSPYGKSKSTKTPNKGRKTSKETAAKQSAAHRAQNKKKDVSSLKKDD
jgi:hypothetical protein